MSFKDKIAQGFDRAVKATESAIDEGKLRVQAYQSRQRADKKAETLGYAVARARATGIALDEASLTTLVDAVNSADAEATVLERKVKPESAGESAPQA